MVENLMNMRQAHPACAVNMNKDIIYTDEKDKITNITVPTASKWWQMQLLNTSIIYNASKQAHSV